MWVILESMIGSRFLVGIAELPAGVLFLLVDELVMKGWERVPLPAFPKAVG